MRHMINITLPISLLLLGTQLLHNGDANRISPAFISSNGKNNCVYFGRSHIRSPRSFVHIRQERIEPSSRQTLFSTIERGGDNSITNQKTKTSYDVIYQKVLRARSKESANSFLLDLITYLQSMYELPDGLTMPYEMEIPDNEENNEESSSSSEKNRAILIMDSPLADDATQARIEVEVIGIFPDSEEDGSNEHSAVPTMAMVALKKIKSEDTSNSVTHGLFADCEKRIIQSFDRGLQELEEGRVNPSSLLPEEPETNRSKDEFNDLDDDGIDAALKRMGYQNAINAAASDVDISSKSRSRDSDVRDPKDPIKIEKDKKGNVIIDSIASSTSKEIKTEGSPSKVKIDKRKSNMNPVAASMQKPKESQKQPQQLPRNTKHQVIKNNTTGTQSKPTRPKIDENEDFAIKMARQKAEALMKTAKLDSSSPFNISGGEGEFAIQAAKRAAARQKPNAPSPSKGRESIKTENISASQPKKYKAQDLSNDAMFLKLQSIANKSKQQSWSKTISKKKTQQLPKEPAGADVANKMSNSQSKTSDNASLKEIEDGVITANGSVPTLDATETSKNKSDADRVNQEPVKQKSDDEIRADIEEIAKNNQEVQDLLKEATDMLPQEADEDLTPEELLERVLKFGDEKQKEEKPGYGFVEGAMGKAKDLLKSEQDTKTDNREFAYEEMDRNEQMKRKAEEDELKRIFAAGQNTVQDKLSKPTYDPAELRNAPMTEEEIDALIAADETVPLNARKLDEEFAEFEVRVARSLGEENDGPKENKMFDVFSGPEVYNPNVDPATAVNWPGAKEGTRTDVQLARELEEALKQAKFAAAVLLNMREEESDGTVRYFVGEKEISSDRVTKVKKCVEEAVKAGIIEDPDILLAERSRLQMLLAELASQPEERLEEIALNYKDLLLSDNFIDLVRERLYAMAQRDLKAKHDGQEDLFKDAHVKERAIMMNLVQLAQGLIKEAQALGAELEVSMLEIIRSICEVAMDPSHTTEEETATALTDAVRDMRPLLDEAFVGYLKYAIAEEEAKLERQGVVDDPEYNRWLFVLKIVQEGVYAELARGVKRYIDHIGYVLRMKTKAERRGLLAKLIEVMPTMDVRPFVKVVNNIVSSLGTSVKGDFSDGVVLGEMTNKLLQLQRDVEDILPPERIKEMSKDADNWAATQRERLMERQRLTRQRLRAARETGAIDADKVIESGEFDRFD